MKPASLSLEARGLTLGYSDKPEDQLFRALHVTLRGGELVCFMGPNGAGKSSLIRTLAGLQAPREGHVVAREGDRETPVHPQRVSVVLTDRITAGDMTVYDLVSFGRYPYLGWDVKLKADDLAEIDRAIDRVHLRPLLSRKIHSLSDGQMQMVMIARALAQDTPIILLDEPTAHLDLNNRVEIMKCLLRLTRETGKAILVATHELDLALQMADQIWLTGHDRNMITGIPEDLVLQGVFDDIFAFKGFDLKTGKVHHEAHRGITVRVAGEGYERLWTNNALDRNGFTVTDTAADREVVIVRQQDKTLWQVDGHRQATSVNELLLFLAEPK